MITSLKLASLSVSSGSVVEQNVIVGEPGSGVTCSAQIALSSAKRPRSRSTRSGDDAEDLGSLHHRAVRLPL